MTRKIELKDLRSQTWFGASGQPGNHKSYRTKQMGYTSEDFQGKPVIGILSTWSDLNSCHTHFPQRIEEIKRGVWQEGGFPVVMPTLSVGESCPCSSGNSRSRCCRRRIHSSYVASSTISASRP